MLWGPFRVPILECLQRFRDSSFGLLLDNKGAYHYVAKVGLDHQEEERERISCGLVGGIQEGHLIPISYQEPSLPRCLVTEQKKLVQWLVKVGINLIILAIRGLLCRDLFAGTVEEGVFCILGLPLDHFQLQVLLVNF